MKKYLFLFVLLMAGYAATAQNTPGTSAKAASNRLSQSDKEAVGKAHRYMAGMGAPQSYEKAVGIFEGLAARNIPYAYNALGIMYREGKGVEQDIPKAIEYFEKAAKLNYLSAFYNLGLIYAYTDEIEQDFGKAFEYFRKGVEQNEQGCCYQAGYMAFKGLGTSQSYEKAVEYFARGTELGRPACKFMLSECYANGYGAPQDMEKSLKMKEELAVIGYTHAVHFFVENKQEETVQRLRSEKRAAPAEEYRRIAPVGFDRQDITGEWTGSMITYDFSGKRIEREEPVDLRIERTGELLQAVWTQGEAEYRMAGVQKDSLLVFENAKGIVLSEKEAIPVEWEMKSASIEIRQGADAPLLVGNLKMYSQTTMEPGQPTMILMTRAGYAANGLDELSDEVQTRLDISPNPVKGHANISFTLKEEGPVTISLYTLNGAKLYDLHSAAYPAGTHTYRFDSRLQAGQYLLLLEHKGQRRSKLLIQQ
ncbi:T9SS type A sorting domain-containing protein [Viscerimonas tarda]